jgi:hypothetical protein
MGAAPVLGLRLLNRAGRSNRLNLRNKIAKLDKTPHFQQFAGFSFLFAQACDRVFFWPVCYQPSARITPPGAAGPYL